MLDAKSFKCKVEAAGSGELLGCVDVSSSMLDVHQSCWLDLQKLVFETFRNKLCTSAACVRLFDGHNGPEMTACEFSKSVLQACVKAWAGWSQRVASNDCNMINIIVVGVYARTTVDKVCIERGWLRFVDYDATTSENKELALAALSMDGKQLGLAPGWMQNDEVFVKAAVRQTGLALCYASSRIQNQHDMFLLALQNYTLTCDMKLEANFYVICLQHCSRMARDAALQVVCICGKMLKCFSQELQQDVEVVLAALRQDHRAFKYAHESLYRNKHFMLQAMELCSQARSRVGSLVYDSDIWDVVCKYGNALAFADQSDIKKDFVMDQVSKNAWALKHAKAFQKDTDVVKIAVQAQGQTLQFAHSSLRARKHIVMAAVCSDGLALQFASEALRNSGDVVYAAIKQNVLAYRFALGFVRDSVHTLVYALKLSSQAIGFIAPYYMTQGIFGLCTSIEPLLNFAVQHHSDALLQLEAPYKTKAILLEALKAFPQSLAHLTRHDCKLASPKELAQHFALCACKSKVAVEDAISAALSCCSRELCIRSTTQLFMSLQGDS